MMMRMPTSWIMHELGGTGAQNSHGGFHLGNFAEKYTGGGSCNPLGLFRPVAGLFLRSQDLRNP